MGEYKLYFLNVKTNSRIFRPRVRDTLLQGRKKASGWDVHAPGYERYTATQAKQTSGLFSIPGANRMQVPYILRIPGLPSPMLVKAFGTDIGNNPNVSTHSRRLYIGNITADINEQNPADFFNEKMIEFSIGTGAPGNLVLDVQCNYEENYAIVELIDLGVSSQAVSTDVPDSIHKIFVSGLPSYHVMELLKIFGELKTLNPVRENDNDPLKVKFQVLVSPPLEYVDGSVTDVATENLNGMQIGDQYLVVQRASVGAKPGTPGVIPKSPYNRFPEIPRPIMLADDSSGADARILLMLNRVAPDDLTDDNKYSDLYDDVKEECSQYGPVEDLRIPSCEKKGRTAINAIRLAQESGADGVYVKYAPAGRSFAGRPIIAVILSDDSQTTPQLDAPTPLPKL
ncbi:hypothetical protein BJ138DRAFT_1172193 [Hygrophoropsis aurantiaca]|uniref:Uncharacterized protein n=1 Tax=Hygrophoropsis aurantiaca TaxID=72124 RepID=A0ACB8AGY0_9AGAM|nr:hypothetical protein BJ138DRAFT_1172193 [Hygrophoropsis aurantiaca]